MNRGAVSTPAFMPVGTAGSVKAMLPESVAGTGAEIVLGNTYHLMLRPGAERIGRLGGLHKFMNWPRPILTDSGGFQVMSLANLRKITEEGVRFRSHVDGAEHFLSPERAMEIQRLLGSDIQMVLDECAPFPSSEGQIEKSLALSMRWARRSKAAFGEQEHHSCFGIVQGGVYPYLRRRSAEELKRIGFDGYAVGGGFHLALGNQEAKLTGPKVSLEIFRRCFRLVNHVQRVQQYLHDHRKFTDNVIKRVELQLRLRPDQFEAVLAASHVLYPILPSKWMRRVHTLITFRLENRRCQPFGLSSAAMSPAVSRLSRRGILRRVAPSGYTR
jgi:hypothetical protein